MPPLPAAAQCLKVRYVGTFGSLPWNCIMHSKYSGSPPTTTDLITFATSLGTAWNTDIAPLCNTSVSLNEVDIVDLSSATSSSGTATMTHAGTRAGTGFPAQVALVSSWIAPLRYRGGHPRNYWPGGVQADLNSVNTWSTAALASFQSGFSAFLTAINAVSVAGGSQQAILLSYHTGHALRPTPLPINITGVQVHPRIDTQRRRLGKEHL